MKSRDLELCCASYAQTILTRSILQHYLQCFIYEPLCIYLYNGYKYMNYLIMSSS